MKDKNTDIKKHLLFNALDAYAGSDFYPCHMPGHKRNTDMSPLGEWFRLDVTEIDGFDDLHHPTGILRDAQENAARFYGAEETFFLVNGSTGGILSAISATAHPGETWLVARNCHKSVYHGLMLAGVRPVYLYPEKIAEYGIDDGISPQAVAEALNAHPEAGGLILTSPTYEGICSDIRGIANLLHERDKILIVDEAHGAHLGLAPGWPENALQQGADIVVQSLHKTLPAPTQTALLHVQGKRVDREKLRQYLQIFQTSSPSYPLMAGIDSCIRFLQEHAPGCFEEYINNRCYFMEQIKGLQALKIGNPECLATHRQTDSQTETAEGCFEHHLTAWDPCKILISAQGTHLTGQALMQTLREKYHMEMEMAGTDYVLGIMTIADARAGWERLAEAIVNIDKELAAEMAAEERRASAAESRAGADHSPAPYTMSAACHMPRASLPLSQAAGKIAADFVLVYPPGVPILTPGEIIGEDEIAQIMTAAETGLSLRGIVDGYIEIIAT